MTARSRSALTAQFDVIRNETVAGANTRARIADAYQDALDSVVSVATVPEIRAFGAKGADTYLVLLNGSYVPFAWDAASTATDDGQTCIQVTGVATGRYRARVTRALPPYCYGDPSVFSDLIASADPNNASVEPVSVYWIGTSRSTGTVLQRLAATSAPGLPWGGETEGHNGLPTSAWTVSTIGAQARAAVAAFGSYTGRFHPGVCTIATCNGGNAPVGNDLVNRMLYRDGYDLSGRIHSLQQYAGRTVTLRLYYLAFPGGITGAHVRAGVRVGASTSQNYYGSYFATYSATPEVRYSDVTIPNTHDWATNPIIAMDTIYRGGQATLNGEQMVGLGYQLICNRGINVFSAAVGGRWTEDYVNEDIHARTLFGTYCAQLPGTKKQLWIELGTNGTGYGFRTVAEDMAYKTTIISRFREYCPSGKVLLITSYPASSAPGGTSTWYRDADLKLAATLPGVACVDTQLAMPTYASGVSAGYYADTVHYNDTGRAAWVAKIAQLCNQAA